MSEFDNYFSEIYESRWVSLKQAMLEPVRKIYLKNPFQSDSFGILEEMIDGAYSLDRASLEPVFALELQEGHTFLDLCAAPGGKSISAVYMTKGALRARLNDSSPDRVQRLKAVLYDYLPSAVVEKLYITCTDGARIGIRFGDTYDRVLADVPCSAERHHLANPKKHIWTLSQSKRLAVRQHALLCSALDSAVPGGRVVYSTCSISPLENDGVVRKLMKSREGRFRVVAPNAGTFSDGSGDGGGVGGEGRLVGEPTEFGRMILPDKSDGFGPIYFSILDKV